MSKSVKWLVGVLIIVTAISIIAVVFMAAHRPDTDEDEEEAVKTPSQVSVRDGRTVITLNPQTQAREGIHVAPLNMTSMHTELRGTAVLLPVNELATLCNNYVAASTKLQRARVDLAVSKSEYERVRTLYEQDQNMSLRAMQAAEATYRTNQAQIEADEQDTKLQLDMVRQRWGAVVANWIERQSPMLERILEQDEFMAQVIFPPGEVAKAPAKLPLQLSGHKFVEASYVSPLPQVNPQVQGISFLYLVPARPGLAVGMNLAVLVPVGRKVGGAVVPQSAMVWWQGKGWSYEQTSRTTFVRREVPTKNPVNGGYFVPNREFTPETRLVVEGAQALLSQEFRSQIQGSD